MIRKVLRATATVLSLLAGVGTTLFVRTVLYRFSIPTSSKLQQVGMWAFGFGIATVVQQKLNAAFRLEADSIANQLERATENPWETN